MRGRRGKRRENEADGGKDNKRGMNVILKLELMTLFIFVLNLQFSRHTITLTLSWER